MSSDSVLGEKPVSERYRVCILINRNVSASGARLFW